MASRSACWAFLAAPSSASGPAGTSTGSPTSNPDRQPSDSSGVLPDFGIAVRPRTIGRIIQEAASQGHGLVTHQADRSRGNDRVTVTSTIRATSPRCIDHKRAGSPPPPHRSARRSAMAQAGPCAPDLDRQPRPAPCDTTPHELWRSLPRQSGSNQRQVAIWQEQPIDENEDKT